MLADVVLGFAVNNHYLWLPGCAFGVIQIISSVLCLIFFTTDYLYLYKHSCENPIDPNDTYIPLIVSASFCITHDFT